MLTYMFVFPSEPTTIPVVPLCYKQTQKCAVWVGHPVWYRHPSLLLTALLRLHDAHIIIHACVTYLAPLWPGEKMTVCHSFNIPNGFYIYGQSGGCVSLVRLLFFLFPSDNVQHVIFIDHSQLSVYSWDTWRARDTNLSDKVQTVWSYRGSANGPYISGQRAWYTLQDPVYLWYASIWTPKKTKYRRDTIKMKRVILGIILFLLSSDNVCAA